MSRSIKIIAIFFLIFNVIGVVQLIARPMHCQNCIGYSEAGMSCNKCSENSQRVCADGCFNGVLAHSMVEASFDLTLTSSAFYVQATTAFGLALTPPTPPPRSIVFLTENGA